MIRTRWATALWALCAALAARAAPPPPALPSQAALEAALLESVRASCPKARVQLEPSLSRAAARFAQAVEEGRAAPSEYALAFYASLESAEPVPVVGVGLVDAAFADRAVGDLYSRACHFDRAGVAAARYRDRAVVALLTARHQLEIAPLPGRVEPGAEVIVRGQLPRGFGSPRLHLLKPNGSLEQRELAHAEGEGLVFAKVRLDQPGEYTLEVLAEDRGGPHVLALRRIFAGVDPPASPPPERRVEAGESTGLDAVTRAISALRIARGLPAVARDAALDAVAEGHSGNLARTRTFAHVLPIDGDLGARLAKAGYGYRFASENIGLADSPAMAHRGIELSPAHLANLIDPRVQRVGLGAIEGTSPEGYPGIYLTEVFASPIVGLPDPAGDVVRLINTQRARRSLPPLARDARLDRLAEHQSRTVAFSQGPLVAGDTATQARAAVPELRSAAAWVSVGSQPEDALAAKELVDSEWTKVGVGALYASSPTYGPGRLWILVIVAR